MIGTHITLTQSAAVKIREILIGEVDGTMLRVFVQGGGCSGFQQGFTLDTAAADDDFIIEFVGFNILLDAMSAPYLDGTEIDYKQELMGSHFTLNNPNSTGKCGCGSSFSA